ncbi:PREDICTED: transcription initiation factor TFIID subunit 11-like isoform X1 [Nelumbo nucifera]|uniref:Transcription initiation factor TFIID subunit 11-like isoform X1 n=1 Tax=Nelumbo nucifera TaxID=4432 RepID=A0A1U7Z2T4_NELNU|nr:PREDICTED: transcription initiation factor TFIID subunit 11-like isoform X1 [Nelumbo nucifera]XP_010247453.1 PREDICTED: transcription initiation factor TFIID subunit 11-like isoform X1 [Nelumbo nucifera]
MKECELCNHPARMFCDSDQASLCWDCDAKVHGANFLVARHSRSLLCHVCQSPTPWKASGAKLGPTVSVCEKCVNSSNGRVERAGVVRADEESGGNDDEIDRDVDDEDDDVDDDDDDDDEDGGDDDDDDLDSDGEDDDDGENQVVPWSSTPPPPVASSSSSDESSSSGGRGGDESAMPYSFKRMRENADLWYQDDLGCSSSHLNNDNLGAAADRNLADGEATSYRALLMPWRDRKRNIGESTSEALASSLKRFHRDKLASKDNSSVIFGFTRAVDLVSSSAQ